jgi:hypothetical protein
VLADDDVEHTRLGMAGLVASPGKAHAPAYRRRGGAPMPRKQYGAGRPSYVTWNGRAGQRAMLLTLPDDVSADRGRGRRATTARPGSGRPPPRRSR